MRSKVIGVLLVDNGQHGTGAHLASGRHGQFGDDAVGRGEHGMFQLHRFQGEQWFTGRDPLADLDVHPGHRAGQRREQRPGGQLRGGQRETRQLRQARRPVRAVHEQRRPHLVYAVRAPHPVDVEHHPVRRGLDQHHRSVGGGVHGPLGEPARAVQPVADLDLVVRPGVADDLRYGRHVAPARRQAGQHTGLHAATGGRGECRRERGQRQLVGG
ncbi:hypothetical protein GCM10027614_52360 [Micromonospora vulcania]